MTRYSRTDTGLRAPTHAPGRLVAAEVDGIALHWPATPNPIASVGAAKAALRGWQDYHMDGHGWSDIAYQEAVDQAGNVYQLRGLRDRSAANGDEDLNSRYGALLLLVAFGETPSPAMVKKVRERIARHRTIFPGSRRIVGHGQIRPGGTACPGPHVQRLLDEGRFTPPKEKP